MPRRIRGPKDRRLTFLRQWREFRNLTLEKAATRFDMSVAQLSRVETAKAPYTQDFLELAAEAYQTDVASLLMRDPTRSEAMWSIWEKAKPGDRRLIEDMAITVLRRRG